MRPTHTAWVVKSAREGSNEKSRWVEIGAIFPHKSGAGFDLVISDQLAISGRIVCVARKERENGGPGDER
jgi:hypothetical protein